MSKEQFYRGVIVVLSIMFVFFFVKSNDNFYEMTEVSDNQSELLEEQREGYKNIIDSLKESKEETYNIVPLPEYEFTEEEIYMLAQCVEAEAGKHSVAPKSQKYITQVILNRLHSSQYPDTLKEVIYQKTGKVPQFSVAYDGSMDRVPQPETFKNVYSVIVHGTDLPEYVLFFYADEVTNNWVNTLSVYDTIDGTVFAYK